MDTFGNRSLQAREKRIRQAIALNKPDRVPVAPLIVHYYPTRVAGISNKDSMREYEKRYAAMKEMTLQLDLDVSMSPLGFPQSRFLECLGLNGFKWPGGSLRDDQPFQFSCDGTMKTSEYAEFLSDPNGFTLRKIWPQISTTLAPLAALPLPPLFWLSHPYDLAFIVPELVANPQILTILKQLVVLAEEFAKFDGATNTYLAVMKELGYPLAFAGVTLTAFDCIGDFLRGMRGVMTDMYRAPEKLLDTIEMLTPASIHKGIESARATGCSRVFIPLHWGGAGLMSNDQYARFYWPCLKALILGLLDAGLTPVPLFEGDYTPRLEFLKELPKGQVAGHFEVVDRRKAKESLGNTMCFWGNVPASLMTTGTPSAVKADVKELIEIFADNGGLIIDASVGLPDETKPENLAAMVEAAREFGAL